MQVDLFNKDGQTSGQVELQDNIFAIEPNENAMHQAVLVYLAHQRQGNHKTKIRSEVSGGGKKPWRQKGRGTARAGSTRSPIWVGGGTIHGPKVHRYNLKITKKLARLAKKSAFSMRTQEKNLMVVEDFSFDQIKTKDMANVLKNLKLEGEKVLVLLPNIDHKLLMSARNIPGVDVFQADLISTYDILNHKKILLFKGAIENIKNAFNN